MTRIQKNLQLILGSDDSRVVALNISNVEGVRAGAALPRDVSLSAVEAQTAAPAETDIDISAYALGKLIGVHDSLSHSQYFGGNVPQSAVPSQSQSAAYDTANVGSSPDDDLTDLVARALAVHREVDSTLYGTGYDET